MCKSRARRGEPGGRCVWCMQQVHASAVRMLFAKIATRNLSSWTKERGVVNSQVQFQIPCSMYVRLLCCATEPKVYRYILGDYIGVRTDNC